MENEEIFTFIEGENVNLVTSSIKYANLYAKWKNNPKVRIFSRNAMPRSLEEIKKDYEPSEKGQVKDHIEFSIYHKADKKLIGICGLNRINWFNRSANAFLMIGETDYWNKKVATEAVKLLLKYAFEEVNLHRVTGGAAVDNIYSWKVAEKVGFTFEGISKEDFYVDGKYVDNKKYYYLKRDWLKRQENQ
ncbi:MAG: GNAT family N-acetyltransferase [Promethearchaeota archaeon]